MKKTTLALLYIFAAVTANADPRLSSWFTDCSGQYARAFETTAEQNAQNAGTTWDHPVAGRNEQLTPTYCGIHEISYTSTHVYIRTTGLGSHVMGPWYGDVAKTQIFANFPSNMAVLYELPRVPGSPPVSKTSTGLGAIGYFVDGVAMFDSRDAFSYDNSAGEDERPNSPAGVVGDDIWNRDAFINESVTFDPSNAHQAGPQYHYHANPPGLRNLLGDSVDHNPATNAYTENFNGQHSPILGWVRDGYPVYGPYGYDDPNDSNSGVRRMISGYQKRDGSNGSTDLNTTGRTSLPQWAAAVQGIGPALAAGQYGPAVTAGAGSQYELGHYIEDYAYKGDLGLTLDVDFDLDLHNGRFCVTPEFPGGTYAYFVAIESDGAPAYPYNIGREYYGNPTGQAVSSVPVGATKQFEGGPESELTMESVTIDPPSGDVTIKWNAVEGGKYTVTKDSNMTFWTPVGGEYTATGNIGTTVDPGAAMTDARQFYKVDLNKVSAFDTAGFAIDGDIVEGSGTPPTFVASFPTSPALPPFSFISTVTVGGVPATVLCYNQATGEVELMFDDGTLMAGSSYDAILTYTPPGGSPVMVTSTNQYTVPNPSTDNNILLLIVDDWGLDARGMSAIPATSVNGSTMANMTNLDSLATGGLRFLNAYANPTCSPTRATLMTGRYPFQTTVWTPQQAANFSTAETTIPEIFTAASSPYDKAMMGKWHLGGGNTGATLIGGWDEFYGINGGGVNDFLNWTKTTDDGVNPASTANSTTYTTTDQVNEAIAFINRAETDGDPWFCWLAFNSVHSPFHTPPAGLAPSGGYSTPATGNATIDNYVLMQEALDTEIGRLLAAVNQSNTNIIVVGDNGTPTQVVQEPFGPPTAPANQRHAKGDLYEGGVHVPMIVKGPVLDASLINTTTTKLVHVADLFSTIIELAGINPAAYAPADALAQSTSIVPILTGTDSADRCVVAENANGRTIRVDDYPDYKLIVNGSPTSTTDTPSLEFFNISTDVNEQTPLYNGAVTPTPPLAGTDLLAFTACLAKDTALGGGYSDPPVPLTGDVVYLELPNPGMPQIPGNLNLDPDVVTVNGSSAGLNYISRFSYGTDLANEADDVQDRYWVKVQIDPPRGPYTSGVVDFPDGGGGNPRIYNAINVFTKP